MSNTATTLGVEAVNKARQTEVSDKAQRLIKLILDNNKAVKCLEGQIAEEQKALAAIAEDVVTQQVVLGTEFTPPLNPNQATILEAIKKINESRQASIALKGTGHANNVLRMQETIKCTEKNNEDLRKQLGELAIDVVTVSAVAGQ